MKFNVKRELDKAVHQAKRRNFSKLLGELRTGDGINTSREAGTRKPKGALRTLSDWLRVTRK